MSNDARPNLGITAARLIEILQQRPELDVMIEDVSMALMLVDVPVTGELEGKHVPLQRVTSVRLAYVRADYDEINHDMDYSDEPFEGSKPVLRIRGINTPELDD